jgi:hypothetical protein
MGRPIVQTVTLADADADGYAQTQKPLAGGNLTLNGALVLAGVGTPDTARRVAIASDADDSARTFTVYGTANAAQGGIAISESVTPGPNAASVSTTQDFATVTRIAVDAATAGNITAGTNTTGSSPWIPLDNYGPPMQVAATGYVMSGSPTYQLDYTNDDVFGTWLPSNVPFPRAQAWPSLTGKTGTANAVIDQPVRAVRLTLTAVGSVQLTVLQQQGI